MERVYLLYREISDQYGTDEIVGAYSTEEKARAAEPALAKNHRTFIEAVDLDPEPRALSDLQTSILRRMGL